ncbi:hypothetical protein LS68_001290 [Helicobacter sp. MIT 05-5293]|uniref:Uncharacterized protein n=1 Tax=uncultured Helicobacter sp. TaxID=175537 RepID=A0A650EK59_9HELI|nr:hypothetical protein [Helicobacter sp. MIT 05-5293]QGT50109.1 hypothetical protein Helico4rc_2290 [uncultured Helicobacter sp.]TLD81693.1 hypothetical protein LS68_001290 [Helicobacter sp. MIT 05-5293]
MISPDSIFMLVSIFCVALFALIVILYLFGPSPKKAEDSASKPNQKITIEEIMKVIETPKSDLHKLQKAVDLFFEHYNELELSDYRKRMFLFAVVVHVNTSTELIIETEKRLKELNPELASDLGKTLKRALDARTI